MLENITTMFLSFILFLYNTTNSLGWSIIILTLIIRFALLPLTHSSQKSAQKIRELQPEVNEIKQKHKGDTKAQQKAQMELYKKYNINPLAGCLPQILQLVVLIFLYHTLISFLSVGAINGTQVETTFFWLDLAKPDSKYIIPALAFISQLVLSLMILPGGEVRDIVPNNSKKKKVQEENKKEEGMADMAATMQKQMLFIMPVMTGIIAIQFPSGVALYWVITTIFSAVQQYYISGWGGLITYSKRAHLFIMNSIKK